MSVLTTMYTFKFVTVEEVISTTFRNMSTRHHNNHERDNDDYCVAAELVAKMEEEKAAIHAEYEQERIAYQKLLKEYNTLEAANDDLKEKVNMLRGGETFQPLIAAV